MAISNESAGHGSASGSAPHHVPAIHPAQQASAAAPDASFTSVIQAVITAQTMLSAIAHLVDTLLDGNPPSEWTNPLQALLACAEKGVNVLPGALEELDALAGPKGGVR